MNQLLDISNIDINVALADDHVLLREGVCGLIHRFGGFKVTMQADHGQHLIDQLSVAEPFPDLCILDISMPVMNGYEALAIIKKRWPKFKVIILSLIDEEFTILQMLKGGAHGYILKSSDPPEFKRAMVEVSRGGFYFAGLIPDKAVHHIARLEIPNISERQIEFLKLCSLDINYGIIAMRMGISIRAVESIQQKLSEKLQIHSRIGLALFAKRTGIIE